jgi:hypothetical protein
VNGYVDVYARPVFELPEGWGVEPPVVCSIPPNKMPWDTPEGQFQPPPVVNDAESHLCAMTMTMNRQMSTPHLFFDNSNDVLRETHWECRRTRTANIDVLSHLLKLFRRATNHLCKTAKVESLFVKSFALFVLHTLMIPGIVNK